MPRPSDDFIERMISEAVDSGEFSDLPGEGKPITGLDASYDPAWWAKSKIERERLQDRESAIRDELPGLLRRAFAADEEGEAAVRFSAINATLSAAGIPRLDEEAMLDKWRRAQTP
ncbi:MAG: DUF1992 domain-containing protein [Acidimicrobiia bacterium]|nr:DUF1992 domain-containing protein [Acidimicrobiia bacterium]